MSFDQSLRLAVLRSSVLIPFVQGNVFRPVVSEVKSSLYVVLIPFVQGNVFRQIGGYEKLLELRGLNPFRTGQCLSTRT